MLLAALASRRCILRPYAQPLCGLRVRRFSSENPRRVATVNSIGEVAEEVDEPGEDVLSIDRGALGVYDPRAQVLNHTHALTNLLYKNIQVRIDAVLKMQ